MIFNLPEEKRKEYNLKYDFGREGKTSKKYYPFSVLLDNIKTFAELLGINAKSTTELIQGILDYKEKIEIMNQTDPDKALAEKEFAIHASSKQSITDKFTSFVSNAATIQKGYLGLTDSIATVAEYTSQDALGKSILKNPNLQPLDITKLKGVELADKTTIDQIAISIPTEEGELFFGLS
jgi:uncharacterized short protein YbdD (DUF466 family)